MQHVMQLFGDNRLINSQGRTIDSRNTVVIMIFNHNSQLIIKEFSKIYHE